MDRRGFAFEHHDPLSFVNENLQVAESMNRSLLKRVVRILLGKILDQDCFPEESIDTSENLLKSHFGVCYNDNAILGMPTGEPYTCFRIHNVTSWQSQQNDSM